MSFKDDLLNAMISSHAILDQAWASALSLAPVRAQTSATTGAANGASSLTLEGLAKSIKSLKRDMAFGALVKDSPAELANLKVVESELAVREVPQRVHKKRRNQSAKYHARIQKKWTKRLKTKKVPVAYMLRQNGQILVAHPSIAQELKRLPAPNLLQGGLSGTGFNSVV